VLQNAGRKYNDMTKISHYSIPSCQSTFSRILWLLFDSCVMLIDLSIDVEEEEEEEEEAYNGERK
jgi:hypothetical protein